MRGCRGWWFGSGLLLAVGAASAEGPVLLWLDEWATPERGRGLLAVDLAHSGQGGLDDPSLEAEVGVTDRWTTLLALTHRVARYDTWRPHGFFWQHRLRFGEERLATPRHGLSLAWCGARGEPAALELGWIGSMYLPGEQQVSVNLTGHQPLAKARTDWNWAAGWARGVGRWSFGVEALGCLNDGTCHLGPTVAADVWPNTLWYFGLLVKAAGDVPDVVGNLRFEWGY